MAFEVRVILAGLSNFVQEVVITDGVRPKTFFVQHGQYAMVILRRDMVFSCQKASLQVQFVERTKRQVFCSEAEPKG